MGMKSRWVLMCLPMALAFVLNSCGGSNNVSGTTSFMWVATQGDQMVRSYTISQKNGSINPIGSNGTPVATGAQPEAMIITPDGKSMFMANADGTVAAYTIKGDGTLSAAGSPVNAGSIPVALTADPAGKFLFVANQGSASDVTSGTISVFAISGNCHQNVAKSTAASPCDPLEHVLRQNAATGEFRAFSHQLKECVLTFRAEYCNV